MEPVMTFGQTECVYLYESIPQQTHNFLAIQFNWLRFSPPIVYAGSQYGIEAEKN